MARTPATSRQQSTTMMKRPDAGFGSTGSGRNTTVVEKTPPRNTNGIKVLAATNGGLSVQYKNNPANGLGDYLNLREAVNGQNKPSAPFRMQAGTPYVPSTLAYGAQRPLKQITSSYGDDMAAGIEGRVASRVNQPRPLRGVSTEGRSPMVSPMAGQGAPGFNPLMKSPLNNGFTPNSIRREYDQFAVNNSRRGNDGNNPMPTSGSPSRTALISDDPDSFTSPNTIGRVAGGLLGGVVGGPAGGLFGSKLGGMAIDKAREYGHPVYGYGRGNNDIAAEYDNPSLLVGQGKGTFIDPMTGKPAQGNSAVQSTPTAAQAQAFRPSRGAYPNYYSKWAGLPQGLFG